MPARHGEVLGMQRLLLTGRESHVSKTGCMRTSKGEELVSLESHSSRVILNPALCLLPRYPTELGWKLVAVGRDGILELFNSSVISEQR